jgi:hypothetical protein
MKKSIKLMAIFLYLITNSLWCIAIKPLQEFNSVDTVKVFNIKDYGAVGDGKTLNTEAINNTIADCSKAGGGTVLVPAGRFLSGTVHLKSNITLFLDKNATIMATADKSQFQGSDFKEEEDRPINLHTNDVSNWTRALILIDKAENVTITGTGTIDGMTLAPNPDREIKNIMSTNSKNVVISNITVTRSGDWSIVGFYVEYFKVKNVTITDGYDGIHVRGGKNLEFDNCKIYSRDDAIAGGYWENALITNCTINSACNGIRIVLPTTNMEIKNCFIVGPGVFGHNRGPIEKPWINNMITGIIFQPGAWGIGKGKSDNVYIHDIIIKDAYTALTFVINEGNTANNIRVENIIATGITNNACSVEAWPEGSTYENVRFKNISISYNVTDPEFIKVKNFERPLTESRPLPYWGFYVRNVKNIEFENVNLNYTGNVENRPLMGFYGVEHVLLKNVKYKKVAGIQPIVSSENTQIKIIHSGPFN